MKRPRVDVLAELDELQQLAACGRGAPDRLRGLASSGDPLLSRWSHLLHTAASLPQHKPVATPVSEEEGQDEEEGDEEAHEEEGLGGKTGLFFPTSQLRDNFDALAGLEGPKQALLESLVLPRLYPGCFRRNFCPFKRILLFGPPGTGKVSLKIVVPPMFAMRRAFFCSDESNPSRAWCELPSRGRLAATRRRGLQSCRRRTCCRACSEAASSA